MRLFERNGNDPMHAYLIEINVPGEGWRPLDLTTLRLGEIMPVMRDLYPGDEIHDTRVRCLKTRAQVVNARLAILHFWNRIVC